MSHTPTPWEEKKYDIINRAERAGYEFSVAQKAIESEEQKRLNAHDELVAACLAALRTPNIYDTDQQSGETPESLIRAALAKVQA
jgi:hypothetical protein